MRSRTDQLSIWHPRVKQLAKDTNCDLYTAMAYLTAVDMDVTFLEMPYFLSAFHRHMGIGCTYEQSCGLALQSVILAPQTTRAKIQNSFNLN